MRKDIGLVVEGGGTKAAYSAGVLKCLLEEKIYLPYAVGISAGCEILVPYVSRQMHRLELTGIQAPCQKGVFGLRPLLTEGSLYGLEETENFIESNAPLDMDRFMRSETQMDFGLYDLADHQVRYYNKSYLDEDHTLVKASCALLLLAHPYEFRGRKVMDAGLVDMISINQSIRQGNRKHIVISTKELGYVRKPAPEWQLKLAKKVYKDDRIVEDFRNRHIRYQEQWDKVNDLEAKGNAIVLRPHKDLGVTRYTTDPKKLGPWFQLGYDETHERIHEIKKFCEVE
ncbi:patatin-like phospholipase family protein [Catenisphaera adipataccumulans]|jgi:predicted patatin/cPLA2 family phospholipase|uniref:Putative patatin/cPLA2 family phospholipase n=1 Tax=Catenisphaera adipataccumulans TaxID=700500 RepID=A0A7W8CWN5_9FIRM|nr:patatin family protein [Catenisphaera adipataccumulans]MBB5182938.1 putative patatin/cPLA2 family phospholipase [Catenisphaera adipataccumulans]